MKHIMHDRKWSDQEQKVDVTCPIAEDLHGDEAIVIYIQDAIDTYDAEACPTCMPNPDGIAYDIVLEFRVDA